MNLFFMEVTALRLDNERALIENARKLLSSPIAEEESDTTESSERSTFKEVDIFANHVNHLNHESLLTCIGYKSVDRSGALLHGYREIFSPPPERIG